MSEYQPPEQIREQLQKAAKLRAMIATPGWQDVVLPYLDEIKTGHEQVLINTEWADIDEMNKCRYKIVTITQFLGWIDTEIAEANKIESKLATKEALKTNG